MENTDKQSGYNQQSFVQIRLNEQLSLGDKLSINLFGKEGGDWNYKNVKNILLTVLQTIWSKLTTKEIENINQARKELNEIFEKFPYAQQDQHVISKALFLFRNMLEELMDSHGFNPSKDDLSKSIIKM